MYENLSLRLQVLGHGRELAPGLLLLTATRQAPKGRQKPL